METVSQINAKELYKDKTFTKPPMAGLIEGRVYNSIHTNIRPVIVDRGIFFIDMDRIVHLM